MGLTESRMPMEVRPLTFSVVRSAAQSLSLLSAKAGDESLDAGDVEEDGAGGGARTSNLAQKTAALRDKRGRYVAILEELQRSGVTQMSLTDLDSRAMAAQTKVAVGYNVQFAVDAKHKLIVE